LSIAAFTPTKGYLKKSKKKSSIKAGLLLVMRASSLMLSIIELFRTQDGLGLPAGQGNAVAGEKIYNAKCASCHGPDAKGGPVFGTMVGGIGSFTTNARVLTPGSMYPYAPILFDYVRRAMPMDKPQSLTNDEVYALSAYILNLNGLVGKTDEMNSKTLAAVKMPNRDGFMVDDRPDTHAVRCMTNCKQ
jgi:cytochrome c